jgi:hypothetical protein
MTIEKPTVTIFKPGTYVLKCQATDSAGLTGHDQIVLDASSAPIVDAGANKLVTLTLAGLAIIDIDDAVVKERCAPLDDVTYLWTQVSGPSGVATIESASSRVTQITFEDLSPENQEDSKGIYEFELTVNDSGEIASDTVYITVQPGTYNAPPEVIYAATTNPGYVFCKHPDYGTDWYPVSQRIGESIYELIEYEGEVYAGTYDYQDDCGG